MGHFSSDRTKVALPIYEKNELVLVSPSSTSVNLKSDFFFRTVPSDEIAARKLAKYLNKEAKKKKVAVLWTAGSDYSESLKKEFSDFFSVAGDVVGDPEDFDLSSNNFTASIALNKAKNQGATAIILIPGGTTDHSVNKALEIIKSHKDPDLIMVAGDSLYIERVLKEAGERAVGLVVATWWHPLSSNNKEFLQGTLKLWKTTSVSGLTATAYDATWVLIKAIKTQPQPSRDGIQKVLSNNTFQNQFQEVRGATGEIKFKGSDRANAEITLVTVVPYCSPISGYYFVPVDYLPKLPNQSNGEKCFPLNPNQ